MIVGDPPDEHDAFEVASIVNVPHLLADDDNGSGAPCAGTPTSPVSGGDAANATSFDESTADAPSVTAPPAASLLIASRRFMPSEASAYDTSDLIRNAQSDDLPGRISRPQARPCPIR
jgi:hypothetical protein